MGFSLLSFHIPKMTVTEAVKEQFLGSSEQQLSLQARSTFNRHAQKDEEGELFMNEEDFINAVAPKQEDYVRVPRAVSGIRD